jgi:hypothetical protein
VETVSGFVSVYFGLFVVYQIAFVNGLFGHIELGAAIIPNAEVS